MTVRPRKRRNQRLSLTLSSRLSWLALGGIAGVILTLACNAIVDLVGPDRDGPDRRDCDMTPDYFTQTDPRSAAELVQGSTSERELLFLNDSPAQVGPVVITAESSALANPALVTLTVTMPGWAAHQSLGQCESWSIDGFGTLTATQLPPADGWIIGVHFIPQGKDP